ncbi:MAG TPA: patatin-like phospholipase family protein [Thermoanaerobaculia bacterium]
MKKCDLVMKGGVTSGIVYPGAICELAKEYSFANIGGTSAGAIAASLTAAAEYRRRADGSDEGFRQLAELPLRLSETEEGVPLLRRLFQPDEASTGLFDVLTAAMGARPGFRRRLAAGVAMMLRRFHRFSSMVAAVVVLLMGIVIWLGFRESFLASAVASSVILAISGAVLFVLAAFAEACSRGWRILPGHGFGLCSGRTVGDPSNAGLTDWLTETIESIAGRSGGSDPLTFGDLRTIDGGSAKSRTINLEMMTTNLTHGRPYRFPLQRRTFYFAASEMRRLFPRAIVDWMIARSRTTTHRGRPHLLPDREELLALPAAADLPIVVATRMSLSFPILLSAVPLYAFDFGRRGSERKLERCWFSDGGLTSNFPVHFFDAPLPRWPTFAFNLAEKSDRYHEKGQRIHLPRSNSGGLLEWWTDIETLPQFLGSIIATMQNWRDSMLLRMPGQRDRIAHVLLSQGEGGLQLTMPPDTIEDVARRGAEAAAVLRKRFGDAPPDDEVLTWRNHKWVRFRAFMRAMEGAGSSCARAFDDEAAPPSFRQLLDGPQPSYAVRPEALATMKKVACAFIDNAAREFAAGPFRAPRRQPKPVAVLRTMPEE